MKPTRKTKLDRAATGEGASDAALRGASAGLHPIADGREGQKTISDILAGNRSTLDVPAGGLVHRSTPRARASDLPAPSPASPPGVSVAIDPALHSLKTVAELGALVRAARLRQHLSQQRFADLAGVGRRFVSELEGGKPTLEAGLVLNCCLAAGIDILARPRNQ